MRRVVLGGALALAAIFAAASVSAADKADAEAALAACIDADITFAERTKALSDAGIKVRHIEKDKDLQRLLRAGLALERSIRLHPNSFKGADPEDFEVEAAYRMGVMSEKPWNSLVAVHSRLTSFSAGGFLFGEDVVVRVRHTFKGAGQGKRRVISDCLLILGKSHRRADLDPVPTGFAVGEELSTRSGIGRVSLTEATRTTGTNGAVVDKLIVGWTEVDFVSSFMSIFLSDRIDTVIRTQVTRTEPLP